MRSSSQVGDASKPMKAKRHGRPRIPPRQTVTDKFPVLTYGRLPSMDLREWRFNIFGAVEKEVELAWEDLIALPQSRVVADFHCATLWSRLDDIWDGVLFKDIVELACPLPEARFVMVYSYGGFTTNLALEALMDDDVILARRHNGEDLSPEHGWPLRLVVPSRYAWKSAKWINGIELMATDRPGFWERRGFSMRADPWKEERFWPEIDLELALTVALCSDKL